MVLPHSTRRKKDGSLQLCVDYRALNKVTTRDSYPLPKISEILDSMAGSTIFSTLDATSRYHQILLSPKDREKTAFAWKNGLYEYTRMPFGLTNAPATFQRIMDTIFRREIGKFVQPYLDDIIVFSRTKEEHAEHLKLVMGRLRAAGIALNKAKCKFAKKEVRVLGHRITEGYVQRHKPICSLMYHLRPWRQRQTQHKNRYIESNRPNELWQVDLIGYLNTSATGKRYIFVAIDHYTKWMETRALKTKD